MSVATWAARDTAAAQVYWETRAHQYRALVAAFLAPVAPFDSLLEVGCHAGPNLWAIRQQYPRPQLYGVDPSGACVEYARVAWNADAYDRMTLAQRADYDAGRTPETLGVEFFEGIAPGWLVDFSEMLDAHGLTLDVALTVYTMAYLTVAEADATLERLVTLAQRAVVLVEPMRTEEEEARVEEPGRIPAWARNYASWFALRRPDWRVTVRPFPGPQGLNTCLIARRA